MKRVLKYKVVLGCFIIVSAFLLVLPVQALEPLVLYDDFDSKFIDAEKWIGFDGGIQEVIREIVPEHQDKDKKKMLGCLHMYQRSYGPSIPGNNVLQFRDPGEITGIKASIEVNSIKAVCCPAPCSDLTVAQAVVGGSFFNSSDTQPLPDNREGDVMAFFGVQRFSNSTDPPNTLIVNSWIMRCSNPSCSPLEFLSVQPLGNVKIGKSVNLTLQWDKLNNQFIFQRDNDLPVNVPYTVSDTFSPVIPFKQLVVQGIFQFNAEWPWPMTSVEASFDNVYVNQFAAQ